MRIGGGVLPEMNLKLMLEATVKRYPGKAVIVSGERRMTYAELDEASNKVANAVMNMGVTKGDRVATLLPNSPEFVVIYFGIVKAGGIVVPRPVVRDVEGFTLGEPGVFTATGLSAGASLKHTLQLLERQLAEPAEVPGREA